MWCPGLPPVPGSNGFIALLAGKRGKETREGDGLAVAPSSGSWQGARGALGGSGTHRTVAASVVLPALRPGRVTAELGVSHALSLNFIISSEMLI